VVFRQRWSSLRVNEMFFFPLRYSLFSNTASQFVGAASVEISSMYWDAAFPRGDRRVTKVAYGSRSIRYGDKSPPSPRKGRQSIRLSARSGDTFDAFPLPNISFYLQLAGSVKLNRASFPHASSLKVAEQLVLNSSSFAHPRNEHRAA